MVHQLSAERSYFLNIISHVDLRAKRHVVLCLIKGRSSICGSSRHPSFRSSSSLSIPHSYPIYCTLLICFLFCMLGIESVRFNSAVKVLLEKLNARVVQSAAHVGHAGVFCKNSIKHFLWNRCLHGVLATNCDEVITPRCRFHKRDLSAL